jgi:hypothetical protein
MERIQIEEKINSLTVDENWKAKFKVIADSEPISFGLIPKFQNNNVWTKAPITTKMNFWALFGLFYYIAKGMWKKGVVLSVLGMLFVIVVTVLFGEKIGNAASFAMPALFISLANLDFYRKMVLDEDFWF